ncbi:MAG: hypothetical protein Q9220_006183 [cf. Caloplaca sp. 1 TL-2023]
MKPALAIVRAVKAEKVHGNYDRSEMHDRIPRAEYENVSSSLSVPSVSALADTFSDNSIRQKQALETAQPQRIAQVGPETRQFKLQIELSRLRLLIRAATKNLILQIYHPILNPLPPKLIALDDEFAIAAAPVLDQASINKQPPLPPPRRPFTAAPTPALVDHSLITSKSALPRLPHRRMHYIRPLGSGGEGRCSLFQLHTPPSKLLVIKALKSQPAMKWISHYKRKPLEAFILQDLLPPHPNIIQLYDYVSTPRSTTLYYEYAALGDLQRLIDKTNDHRNENVALDEQLIWHIFSQLASAVAFLHHGPPAHHPDTHQSRPTWTPILHRDIKPANILLTPSLGRYPNILLADFGLAIPLRNTDSVVIEECGTRAYQPPESPLTSTASDIWAIGAVVHALVWGYPPGWVTGGWEVGGWVSGRWETGVEGRGYGRGLGRVVGMCLKERRRERVGGGELVEEIRKRYPDV